MSSYRKVIRIAESCFKGCQYGKKVIILLDEYDTLLQEAYVSGYWNEMTGFTKLEVAKALKSYGLEEEADNVQRWYDGFIFGTNTVIYNPWSITNYLKHKKFEAYWASTSSNRLIGKLIRQGNADIKQQLFALMQGESIITYMAEQVVFNQLDDNEEAIWSLTAAKTRQRFLSLRDFITVLYWD